jgi:hypothetical protein
MARVSRSLLCVVAAAAATAAPSSARTASCGHLTYRYRAGGAPYNAILAGTDYHGPISAGGVNCTDARRFVHSYAQIGFRGARGRLDFRPPRSYHRFHCRRIRDGDDSGRNFYQRGRQSISFSDSDGQFA